MGRIPRSFTKATLRRKFECFGQIEVTSVHFREHGSVSVRPSRVACRVSRVTCHVSRSTKQQPVVYVLLHDSFRTGLLFNLCLYIIASTDIIYIRLLCTVLYIICAHAEHLFS